MCSEELRVSQGAKEMISQSGLRQRESMGAATVFSDSVSAHAIIVRPDYLPGQGQSLWASELKMLEQMMIEPILRIRASTFVVSQEIVKSVQFFSGFPAPQSRREAMLEALRRAKELKAELREKYGEFNIEEDLEELRNARLGELEQNL